MRHRQVWGQRPREVYVPQQGPEERGHVYLLHEGERVTDPMLPVSVALFSPDTGLPPSTASRENLPLCPLPWLASPGRLGSPPCSPC